MSPDPLDEMEPLAAAARWSTALAALSGALALWVLLYPFDFRAPSPGATGAWLGEVAVHHINTVGNLLVFAPLAACLGWRGRARGRGGLGVVLAAGAAAAALSLLVESLQLYLPHHERTSSAVDVAVNALGALPAAVVGFECGPRWTAALARFRQWVAGDRLLQGCLWATLGVLLLRTAPLDVSPETWHLKQGLYSTWDAGPPLAFTTAWVRSGARGLPPSPALLEMGRAASAGILFAVYAYLLAETCRARWRARGDFSSPTLVVLLLAGGLVLATELLQWPVRSRLMDATEPVGGLLGVAAGATVDWLRARLTDRHR